jgi:two-component sensor histidine kinase/ligand-binding sensor domain-containing protein/PAS domain-containing protein
MRIFSFIRYVKSALLLLLILMNFFLTVHAKENPVFSHLTTENGLTQEYITSITQDQRGFIWIGTQEGLNRWDGIDVKQYLNNPGSSRKLTNDYVTDVVAMEKGKLWIATLGGGLNFYDEKNDHFSQFTGFPSTDKFSSDRIKVLFGSLDSKLWVGTESDGIYIVDGNTKSIKHLTFGDSNTSLSSNNIRDIKADKQGRIWIATEGGGVNMWDVNSGHFIRYQSSSADPDSLVSNDVLSVTPMRDGTVWAGTYNNGISIINPHQRKSIHYSHQADDYFSLSNDRVRSIFEDADGRVWVGTDSGLDLWNSDNRTFNHYYHDDSSRYSLTDNRISNIMQDKSGVLWVGTFSGVNKWNARLGSIEHIKKNDNAPSTLSTNIVTSFAQSEGGNQWIGTWGGGLNYYDKNSKQYRIFKHDESKGALSDDRVMSLLVDSKNRLWVGTALGGLNLKLPGEDKFIIYQYNPSDTNSISNNGITRIFEDSKNRIWVATIAGGVNLFTDNGFIRFKHDKTDPSSIGSNRVLAISESPNGIIWFATDGGGVSYYSPESRHFTSLSYKHPTHSIDKNMSFISILAKDNKLWLGGKDSGLLLVKLNKDDQSITQVKRFGRQDGLPSNVIFGILEDDTGLIWLSSNKGISVFTPETESIKSIGTNQGLQGNEFNSGAYYKSGDGTMYFGGNNGFNRFNPRHVLVSNNRFRPDTVITNISIFNQSLKLKQSIYEVEKIQLEYFDNFLTFRFAAMEFTQPDKNLYQYRLIGISEQWTKPSFEYRASFANLAPGDYQFEVRSANNDGMWGSVKNLKVIILPPVWRTSGAYLGYFILLMMFIYFNVTRFKKKTLEDAEKQTNYRLKMYLSCLEEASDGVAIVDNFGEYVYRNKSFSQILEKTINSRKSNNISETLFSDKAESQVALISVKEKGSWRGLVTGYEKQQEIFIELGLTKVSQSSMIDTSVIVVAHDITSLKRNEAELIRYRDRLESVAYKRTHELENEIKINNVANEKIVKSLAEKEVLLKEIHHRVKNNLQVISSLLNMQASATEGEKYKELLNESQNRIRSMALIHESLYQSDNFLEIDFNDYIHLLASTLSRSYSSNTYGIDIQIQADNVFLDIDRAIPCGLIINELVSNAYKHAFSDREEQGIVLIKLKQTESDYILVVKDNGVGFPEGVDFRNTSSLGMEIVCILCQQIKATIELTYDDGASFCIRFPILTGGDK